MITVGEVRKAQQDSPRQTAYELYQLAVLERWDAYLAQGERGLQQEEARLEREAMERRKPRRGAQG